MTDPCAVRRPGALRTPSAHRGASPYVQLVARMNAAMRAARDLALGSRGGVHQPPAADLDGAQRRRGRRLWHDPGAGMLAGELDVIDWVADRIGAGPTPSRLGSCSRAAPASPPGRDPSAFRRGTRRVVLCALRRAATIQRMMSDGDAQRESLLAGANQLRTIPIEDRGGAPELQGTFARW